jgi:nitrogen-specific signal transduction histidine kinase/CheY-like chemotaxis protein
MIDTVEDVTAQRQLEERLRQAQKMEAVGQLAGGIAHDFNNLLTVISGNLEFVQGDLPADLPADHPTRGDLAEIASAAERARTLVRQLLAFSRKQPVRMCPLQVGEVVRGAERLLRRVIGEEIVLDVALDDLHAPAAVVHADPGQLEQVLMNLAVNARDAMLTPMHGHPGTGGTLTIETAAVTLSADEARAWDGLAAGPHVRLRVQDTGHGMDALTRSHVFEPFFTTKDVGAGTGLGLATVFGIVRQAGGAVQVESAPGAGTTFTMLLPVTADADASVPSAGRDAEDRAAPGATVLLVEDEAPVRTTTRRVLERSGYVVLEARHGADALLLWARHGTAVDAVVTDLRMPEMGGRELVARLREVRPTLPVVFLSGYTERAGALDDEREVFVDKPFASEALLAALQRAIAAARSGDPAPLAVRP